VSELPRPEELFGVVAYRSELEARVVNRHRARRHGVVLIRDRNASVRHIATMRLTRRRERCQFGGAQSRVGSEYEIRGSWFREFSAGVSICPVSHEDRRKATNSSLAAQP